MDYKKAILEKGLKNRFIAKKIGCKEPIFSMYINGKVKNIPAHIIKALEEILK